MDDLGCTACHLGEGMARDLTISHGVPGGLGARKVLAGMELQASCYRCHELKPLPGAKKAWEGAWDFSLNACDTCHNVGGSEGGRYGPDLGEVGSFLGLKQIQTAIEDPRADPENSIMPKFPLSPEQIKNISYFLKSRMRESLYETPMIKRAKTKGAIGDWDKETERISPSSEEILREKKCLACHKFKEEDGQIAPDLTFMASMRKEEYIKNFLSNPRKEIPGNIMPSIRLTREEETGIIRSLQKKEMQHGVHEMKPKHHYMTLCQRCHAAQGDGLGPIQPNLANFPRAFWKNAQFFRRIPDERIVKSVENGIPGTSMPPYGELLGQEKIDSLLDLIFREFIRIKRSDKKVDLTIQAKPAALLSKQKTEKEFVKYCSSCHGPAGTGKGPEYLKYLPRPRDLTNQPYFQAIKDERIALAISYGIPGTAMPSFVEKISPESNWSLIQKIRELSNTNGKSGKTNEST
jgi:mono/diheme cytochrome c family protein